jgi:hypothetical protein
MTPLCYILCIVSKCVKLVAHGRNNLKVYNALGMLQAKYETVERVEFMGPV